MNRRLILPNLHGQIIFLDEENRFVKSREFAAAVKSSDNYYVIVTREDLPNLPYSVDEIYGIHTSGKYHDLRRTYNEMYQIYNPEMLFGKVTPEMVVADGAAIGSEMNELYQLMKTNGNVKCYLPESFEWLILKI